MPANSFVKLTKRIIIEKKTEELDSRGSSTLSWTTDASVWAEVKPRSAQQRYVSQQVDQLTTHDVVIRYRVMNKKDYRIKYGARYFRIITIIDADETGEWLKLECAETVA